jgi:deoxyinosine 3'endonuclease (endonuclease V)
LHHVDGLSKARLRDILDAGACPTPGSHATLTGDSGVVWGAALRTTPGDDFKPIFVSVGHAICLQSAVALAWRCCVHRVPEPVRQADLRSREWLRRHGAAEAGE